MVSCILYAKLIKSLVFLAFDVMISIFIFNKIYKYKILYIYAHARSRNEQTEKLARTTEIH